MKRAILLFYQFLKRDYYRYKKQIRQYVINFGILRPLIFSVSIAYIQARVLFGADQTKISTIFFIGNAMLIIMVLTFSLAIRLLFDLEQDRFVAYQITIISPKLLLLERIVFSTLFTFFIMLPFFPASKIILQRSIDTSHTCWPHVFLIMFIGALCLSAYNLMVSCILKSSRQLTSLWMRVNMPLLVLGGLWVPLHIIQSLAPGFRYLFYLNPILYVTEGLRSAILGSPEFLPVWQSSLGLFSLAILFTLLSFYFFKKRVDHI